MSKSPKLYNHKDYLLPKSYHQLRLVTIFLLCLFAKLSSASYQTVSCEEEESFSVETVIIHEEGELNPKHKGLIQFFNQEMERFDLQVFDSQLEIALAIILYDQNEGISIVQSVLRQYVFFLKKKQSCLCHFFLKETFDIKEGYQLANIEFRKKESLMPKEVDPYVSKSRVSKDLKINDIHDDNEMLMRKIREFFMCFGCDI